MGRIARCLLLLSVLVPCDALSQDAAHLATRFVNPLNGGWPPTDIRFGFGRWNEDRLGYHLAFDVRVPYTDDDIANKRWRSAYAPANGIVIVAQETKKDGYWVVIQHELPPGDPDGHFVCSVFFHMISPKHPGGLILTEGRKVDIGETIGFVSPFPDEYANTYPHQHYGIRKAPNSDRDANAQCQNLIDTRTGRPFYSGYTTIRKENNPADPIHQQILSEWFKPDNFLARHAVPRPIGVFDEVRQLDGVIRGWSYDPKHSAISNTIQIFFDGPSGTGTLVHSGPTTVLRGDVNSAYDITGTHGFEFIIPVMYRDNRPHSVYIYGLDLDDLTKSSLLAGSPKTFTLTITNQAPIAGFTMSILEQNATDGGTLNASVAPGGQVQVGLNALDPPRSYDPEEASLGFEWTRDGTRIPLPTIVSAFNTTFSVGTHTISLVVIDDQGGRSAAVTGTIKITEDGLFTVIDLGTLGGAFSQAYAINSFGKVVGFAGFMTPSREVNHPFLWAAGTMQDLEAASGGGEAHSVNFWGDAVGLDYAGPSRPTLWSNGSKKDLGTLSGDGQGVANGINDDREVAGYSYNAVASLQIGHAFRWTETGGLHELRALPGHVSTAAFGINDSGIIAGESDALGVGASSTAVLWANDTPQSLGVLPGFASSTAFAVNSSGQAVGMSFTPTRRAFLWDGTSLVDLGVLPKTDYTNTVAYSLNDNGVAVGYSDGSTAPRHAVLFIRGAVRDLNELILPNSGWDYLFEARGINYLGQIVGWGVKNGQTRAFLLNP
jgi:probable HAF family extracellular repeat protein